MDNEWEGWVLCAFSGIVFFSGLVGWMMTYNMPFVQYFFILVFLFGGLTMGTFSKLLFKPELYRKIKHSYEVRVEVETINSIDEVYLHDSNLHAPLINVKDVMEGMDSVTFLNKYICQPAKKGTVSGSAEICVEICVDDHDEMKHVRNVIIECVSNHSDSHEGIISCSANLYGVPNYDLRLSNESNDTYCPIPESNYESIEEENECNYNVELC